MTTLKRCPRTACRGAVAYFRDERSDIPGAWKCLSCGRSLPKKPRIADLFCGAGGAGMGLSRAGFEVIGFDIKPQPHYPFEFHEQDALTVDLSGFDAVWASPPCQAYVNLSTKDGRHPKLIEPVREKLKASGLPYIIENVVGAPLCSPVRLCGSSFGLGVRRHRNFESNVAMWGLLCQHATQDEIRAYYGAPGMVVWTYGRAQVQKKGRKALMRGSAKHAPADMGIDWMEWDELREAIPPAYSFFLGQQLMTFLERSTPSPPSARVHTPARTVANRTGD